MGWLPYWTILVIPTGATSGQRITIDGVSGQIVMYDSTNTPVIVESAIAGTIAISGPGGDPTLSLGRVTDPLGGQLTPGMRFTAKSPATLDDGLVVMGQDGNPSGYMVLQPPRGSADVAPPLKDNLSLYRMPLQGDIVADGVWFNSQTLDYGTISKNAEPTYIADGAYHLFGSEWPAFTGVHVPPSGTIEIDIYITGHNANSLGHTIAVGVAIDAEGPPVTRILNPALSQSAFITAPAAGFSSNAQAFMRLTVGQDILNNYVGKTIRITPAYRATTGTATNVSVSVGRLTIKPCTYSVGFTT